MIKNIRKVASNCQIKMRENNNKRMGVIQNDLYDKNSTDSDTDKNSINNKSNKSNKSRTRKSLKKK